MSNDIIQPISELMDKLMGEMIKCYDFHRKIMTERLKDKPDAESIAAWEFSTRQAGEKRVALRNAIDKKIQDIIRRGDYDVCPEQRTFTDKMKDIH